MFKSLFKSAWKSDSVEKRLSFISEVDVSTSANQTILENLARNDVDASVRHSAMAKISNLQILYDLWQSKDDVDVEDSKQGKESKGSEEDNDKKIAETTFRNVIQSGCDFNQAEFNTFLAKNPKADIIIATCCPLADVRNEVLTTLKESEQATLISDVAYSATRVMMAENIQSLDSLEIARKNLKGRDKTAEKIIKAKIDVIHAAQKLQKENDATALSIREKMEGLARYINWSDEIRVKFFQLSKAWDSLELDPPEDEKKLYKEAFANVSEDVKHNMAITLSQENQEKIVVSLETLCKKIAPYALNTLIAESKVLNDELNDLSWQLDKESETIPYVDSVYKRFVNAKHSIESAINIAQSVKESRELLESNTADIESKEEIGSEQNTEENIKPAITETITESKIENNTENRDQKEDNVNVTEALNAKAKEILRATKQSAWSKDFSMLAAAKEATIEAEDILSTSKNVQKAAKDQLDKLHQRINRTFGAAKRGDINRAQRDLAAVTKAVTKYEGFDRKKLDERIEELTVEVRKMGDWKDFAIEPKLIGLCEQMEALPELERTSKNPSADKLAKKIKHLQNTWKALGSSDASDTHWPRFKAAADTAYEPCAVFFKKRREIQTANLEKREPLVKKMQDLLESTDWDNKPNFKAVEDSISQIIQSWKQIKDVEHGKGQKQWEKLAKIKDQINTKLDIEYDKNIAAKHALTAQFEQMLEEDVNEQTLDKLKFIQSKWKQVGVTRRKQDQDAWVKFKAASDAVYEKIQGIRQEKRAVEDEQISAYKEIHTQIRTLAKTTQDLAVSDKEFETLEAQYKALPALPTTLPEKLIERLDSDYAKACDAYAGAKDRLNQEKLDSEFETLATKAKLCSELEQLPVSADQAVIDELMAEIEKLEINNKDYQKRFAKRLKKARESDREAFTKARRLRLIECEILLDKESPKEDKDLRLHIQLERMKEQGLGNTPINVSSSMEEHKLEWLCMPGAAVEIQQGFDERFSHLLKN